MDKHILFVKSDIEHTRSQKNKNLVSFHKRFICSFNSTVFENIGVYPGMYARFAGVAKTSRIIKLIISKNRPTHEKSKWYKICNPKVDKRNTYCYIRTTNLAYEFELLPLGAFEYQSTKAYYDVNHNGKKEEVTVVYINF